MEESARGFRSEDNEAVNPAWY